MLHILGWFIAAAVSIVIAVNAAFMVDLALGFVCLSGFVHEARSPGTGGEVAGGCPGSLGRSRNFRDYSVGSTRIAAEVTLADCSPIQPKNGLGLPGQIFHLPKRIEIAGGGMGPRLYTRAARLLSPPPGGLMHFNLPQGDTM
jgi:hypothetical protein